MVITDIDPSKVAAVASRYGVEQVEPEAVYDIDCDLGFYWSPAATDRCREITMGQDVDKIESLYDRVAKEYAETFSGEHEKKPKDQEILYRFSREIRDRRPVWDFGCGPGQTTKYLKNLGIEISGLDLSEELLEQARTIRPEINFRKGNILELDFENDSIAGVVAFYAIVHFTEDQVELSLHSEKLCTSV